MPGPTNKTNFRTYEASTRLLAAVIASNHGKIKLDFNAIATHLGGGTGKDAINHRLRPIRALANKMAEYVAQNKDPAEIPLPGGKGSEKDGELASLMGGGTTGSAVDHRLRPIKQLSKLQLNVRNQKKDPGDLPVETAEIQKLFGESTAGGIAWQFRDIRALGREQQQAVKEGNNPATIKPAGTSGTPSRVKAPAKAVGSTKRRGGRIAGATAAKRRKNISDDGEEDDDEEPDYDAKDVHSDEKDSGVGGDTGDDSDVQVTPTPAKRTKLPTKPRSKLSESSTPAAAAKKNGDATAGGNNNVRRSLFGNGKAAPAPAVDNDDDDEVQVVDLSDDSPVPARKMSTRFSRIKVEREPEPRFDDDEDHPMGPDAFMGSMYSDLDGEA